MLPARHRLTRRVDFREVIRRGVRVSNGTVVVHLMLRDGGVDPRAGLVVSRSVGGSVVRHRVSRQLRGALSQVIPGLPGGVDVVVRALPGAATMGFAALESDVHRGVAAALAKAER